MSKAYYVLLALLLAITGCQREPEPTVNNIKYTVYGSGEQYFVYYGLHACSESFMDTVANNFVVLKSCVSTDDDYFYAKVLDGSDSAYVCVEYYCNNVCIAFVENRKSNAEVRIRPRFYETEN